MIHLVHSTNFLQPKPHTVNKMQSSNTRSRIVTNITDYFGWTGSKTSIIVFKLDHGIIIPFASRHIFCCIIHHRLHTIFLINFESSVACDLEFSLNSRCSAKDWMQNLNLTETEKPIPFFFSLCQCIHMGIIDWPFISPKLAMNFPSSWNLDVFVGLFFLLIPSWMETPLMMKLMPCFTFSNGALFCKFIRCPLCLHCMIFYNCF